MAPWDEMPVDMGWPAPRCIPFLAEVMAGDIYRVRKLGFGGRGGSDLTSHGGKEGGCRTVASQFWKKRKRETLKSPTMHTLRIPFYLSTMVAAALATGILIHT